MGSRLCTGSSLGDAYSSLILPKVVLRLVMIKGWLFNVGIMDIWAFFLAGLYHTFTMIKIT
jgi:hypothetical protein